MAKDSPKFKLIRITETTHSRLKVKAARTRKKIYEVVEALSLA